MRLSRQRLQQEATATGFRVEILEKVSQLLDLLNGIDQHPYLKGRFALKGGTALNLFVFDVPRLSIDIDLNYVGQIDREAMLAERPKVERALEAVCGRAGIVIARARSLNDECRKALRLVLPLAEAEREFLDRLLDHGEIVPALLTNDPELGMRIAAQPMLAWKSLNVRRRKGHQETDRLITLR